MIVFLHILHFFNKKAHSFIKLYSNSDSKLRLNIKNISAQISFKNIQDKIVRKAKICQKLKFLKIGHFENYQKTYFLKIAANQYYT